MMYHWRPTKRGDIAKLRVREWDKPGQACQCVFDSMLDYYSYAYTLFYRDRPYAVVTALTVHPGVCELAVTADYTITAHARAFLTTCRRLLQMAEQDGVRRWQIHVPVGLDVSARLAEHLGFTLEGELAGYYSDANALLYGRAKWIS